VGLLTALHLARAGVPVTVLEAQPMIVRSPRALAYHPPSIKVLAEAGVLQDAIAAGIEKQDYQFREPVMGTVTTFSSAVLAQLTEYPYNLHLGQHVLAEIFLQHLRRQPAFDIRWNTRVQAVVQDPSGVTVTVDSPAGERELRAPWLIAADGSHSTVRRSLNLAFDGHTWPDRFVATNVYCDLEAHGYAQATFVIDPVHWAIIVKINNDNLWRVTYGESPHLSEEEIRQRVSQHYAAILPPGAPYQIDAVAGYRVHERAAARFRSGRVLLAGDAAHVCNPTGGYGLTGGILDAAAAGKALAAVINGQAGDDVLDRYAAERRRIFLELTSPGASENKRRLAETDPEKKRADREHLRRLGEDADYQRSVLAFTLQLAS
jgi:2-polyprenyl-6-methoxyphenol hydroxylase-like FAD-dependent oxidoreductase